MDGFREVYPQVWKLALPLPFELASVNVYLVALEDGYLLIDCGMETDPAFATLSAAMTERGIAWTEIRRIFLTHMHPDHMGLAARLLRLTGATLAMHEAEAAHLQMVASAERRFPWLEIAYTQAGVPKTLESKINEHFLEVRKNFHNITPDVALVGGEEIPTAIGPLQVLWTSGHSPGHVCLYSAERKLLFSGDQILENITPNISWHPGRDMLGEFLESLERLAGLEVELILPSHGEPFSGHRAWIEQTKAHHRERCNEILALIGQSPRSAHYLVGEMWRKSLSPINHHFAIFEVLAHLEHMQRQGRVRHSEENGVLAWHA
ncbi:MAG TPA: MBL fold metallo-hydrolase [Bryobacteraceae bacterium]|nr:MBL fold metallo-hydrolase [Bryobacteraceae bacterium]